VFVVRHINQRRYIVGLQKRRCTMEDEGESSSADPRLLLLLIHYATLGAADRMIWQDRLMIMAGVNPRDLHRLHGELIANGWIEQNTGMTPVLKAGVAANCYRITARGLRAWKTPPCQAPAA
jgi:hypothetical protein